MNIRTRVNDLSFTGKISRIDAGSGNAENQDGGAVMNAGPAETAVGGDGDAARSTNYTFYVNFEPVKGLLLGQHVLLSPATDGPVPDGALRLPVSFVKILETGEAEVLKLQNGKLAERTVQGQMDAQGLYFYVTEGLDPEDELALPASA